MAAIWEKIPDAEPEDIATALRQVAEEYNAEGDELRRYVRMRNQTGKDHERRDERTGHEDINHWQGAIEAEARTIARCFNELADKMEKEQTGVRDRDAAYYHTAVNWLRQLDGKDAFGDLKHFLERLRECERIMADDPTLDCNEPPF